MKHIFLKKEGGKLGQGVDTLKRGGDGTLLRTILLNIAKCSKNPKNWEN